MKQAYFEKVQTCMNTFMRIPSDLLKTNSIQMKLKSKYLKLLILLAISSAVSAQTYRLEVGYNNPAQQATGLSSTYFNGIKLGVSAEFKMKQHFSLLTGAIYNIAYSNKVQKYPDRDSVTYKTWSHSIIIPVKLTYTYPVFKKVSLFAYTGPDFNIGLSQIQKVSSTMSFSQNSFFDITPGEWNLYERGIDRISFQWDLGGGIQWKKFQLKSGYNFGLNNISLTGTKTMQQNGWYASFAYQF